MSSYYTPKGGMLGRTDFMTGRAVFTEAYAVILKGGVMINIVAGYAPLQKSPRLDHRAPAGRVSRDILAIHHGTCSTQRQRLPGTRERGRSRHLCRGRQRDDHAGRAIHELGVGGFGR
jgi:hypothetical protein